MTEVKEWGTLLESFENTVVDNESLKILCEVQKKIEKILKFNKEKMLDMPALKLVADYPSFKLVSQKRFYTYNEKLIKGFLTLAGYKTDDFMTIKSIGNLKKSITDEDFKKIEPDIIFQTIQFVRMIK